MWFKNLALLGVVTLAVAAAAQTPVDVQPIQSSDATGTCDYKPSGQEKSYYKKLSKGETFNGSAADPYTIRGKTNKYIGWFGIVRGITPPAQADGDVTLLVQHRFFDGSTDCPIMVVSNSGGGDFQATLKIDPAMIPPLTLVRIYGVVVGEINNVPQVVAQYVRIWPWRTFTFTKFGPPDRSNPRWAKYSDTSNIAQIHQNSPTEDYYRHVLGNPLEFGLNLKAEQNMQTPPAMLAGSEAKKIP